MAGTYRPLDDGGFLIETPAGALRTALSEGQLQGAGYQPYAGATAFVGDTDQGGAGGAPSVADVPREVPGAAPPPPPSKEEMAAQAAAANGITDPWEAAQAYGADPQATADYMQARQGGAIASGAGGTTGAGGGGGVQGSAAVPVAGGVGAAPVASAAAPSAKPGAGLRGGATVEDIDLTDQVANGKALPPSPARYIKTGGKDIRAGFQVAKSGISDPEREALKEGLGETEMDIRGGLYETARRERNRLEQRAEDFEENDLAEARDAVRKQRERTQWVNTEVSKRQQEISRERRAVEKLEVSPERVYEEGGAWLRIGAVISMIAGGMLQGRRGGNNPGLEAVNKIIADGMEAQRDNRAARERGIAGRETELDRLTALYGSPETAEAELRKRQLDYAEAYAKKFALETGSQDVMMRVEQVFAERDRERMLENAKLDQELRDRVTESWAYQPERGGQAKPKDLSRMVRLKDGSYAWARSDVDARKVQDQYTAVGAIARDAELLMRLSQEAGNRIPLTEAKRQMKTIKTRMMLATKNAEQMGALDKGTQEVFDQMVGSPEDIINAGSGGSLREIVSGAKSKQSDLERDYLHRDADGTTSVRTGRPQSARGEE
jgi:hypothetical protein